MDLVKQAHAVIKSGMRRGVHSPFSGLGVGLASHLACRAMSNGSRSHRCDDDDEWGRVGVAHREGG